MPLAEGPDLGGEFLVLVLLFFLVALAVWCTAVVVGYRAARAAGEGSVRAWPVLLIAVAVELAPGLVGGPNPVLALGLLALAFQVAMYARARG